MVKNAHSVDMLHGSILKKLIALAIPIILASILQQLFNMTDTLMAGKFVSAEALAAVGNNIPVIGMFINLLVGLSIGANVLIARHIALKQESDASTAVHAAMGLALAAGFFLSVLGLLLTEPILDLISVPPEVMPDAATYLRVYFLGMPALTIYNFGSALLRADGDSQRPVYALLISNAFNIVLDYVAVVVFDFGILGLAAATAGAAWINALYITWILRCETGFLHFSWSEASLSSKPIRSIAAIGAPAGLQGIVFSISNIVVQSAINQYGRDAIAGVSAATVFEYFAYFVVFGIAQAAVTFTSQNFAACHYARCKRIFRLSMLSAAVGALILSALFTAYREPLISLFSSSPEVYHYAELRIFAIVMLEPLTALYDVPAACMRGMGVSLLPALETLFGACILRLIYIFYFFDPSADFLFLMLLYPVTWIITGSILTGTYFYVRRELFPTMRNRAAFMHDE
ncbi:MATE family efflux transporter [Selenomonas sp. TAMA-11512]|uniref:MATE family efflux transporter n=1 Tax=Selenomonas sp. TAMA-11512 TaxID=3095337 RepID=UPI003084BCE2|nr:MATE family efflux transporter [Selenomonas sp. TAMA-11512]